MSAGYRPLLFGCFFLLCGSIWYVTVEAQEPRQVATTIGDQTQRQKDIQAETEKMARRIHD